MMIKNYILIVLLAVVAVGLWSCATSGLSFSPKIPAAEGTVKFAKADNGNITIHLVVKHLAHPNNLTPLHSFEIFVTGETSGQVNEPTGDSLFWASYNT